MATLKWVLTFDPRLCDGCGECVEACEKRLGDFTSTPAIKLVKDKEGKVAALSFCLQCEQPFCKMICPTGSIRFDEFSGLSSVRSETCVGCRSCFLICPIEGVMFDAISGKAVKCDLCNGEPKCVKVCERGALKYTLAEALSTAKEGHIALLISSSTKAGVLTAERGLALSKKFVGDTLLFSRMISSRSEGLRKFLDYCASNLSTISNEASLAALSETILKRRRSLGLNEIRRPKEEVQTLLKRVASLKEVRD